jgi:hypothetical protein
MSNMSYCRWTNTAADLADCAADLEERMSDAGTDDAAAPLSRDEAESRRQLFLTAAAMFQQIGIDVDENDVLGALAELDEKEVS